MNEITTFQTEIKNQNIPNEFLMDSDSIFFSMFASDYSGTGSTIVKISRKNDSKSPFPWDISIYFVSPEGLYQCRPVKQFGMGMYVLILDILTVSKFQNYPCMELLYSSSDISYDPDNSIYHSYLVVELPDRKYCDFDDFSLASETVLVWVNHKNVPYGAANSTLSFINRIITIMRTELLTDCIRSFKDISINATSDDKFPIVPCDNNRFDLTNGFPGLLYVVFAGESLKCSKAFASFTFEADDQSDPFFDLKFQYTYNTNELHDIPVYNKDVDDLIDACNRLAFVEFTPGCGSGFLQFEFKGIDIRMFLFVNYSSRGVRVICSYARSDMPKNLIKLFGGVRKENES